MSDTPRTDHAFTDSHLQSGFIHEFCKTLERKLNVATIALKEISYRTGDNFCRTKWSCTKPICHEIANKALKELYKCENPIKREPLTKNTMSG